MQILDEKLRIANLQPTVSEKLGKKEVNAWITQEKGNKQGLP